MPRNSRNKNNNRGRSASPVQTPQPNKKQNTTQTIEPPASLVAQPSSSTLVNDMEVDNTSVETSLANEKGKGKEVTKISDSIASTSMNVDGANDASENFLNNNKSPQEISIK